MVAEPEPSGLNGEVGDVDGRRTDPTVSSVNGAVTTERDGAPPRTPLPRTSIDAVVPQLSTTTRTDSRAPSPVSTTLRSGGSRTLVGSLLGRYEVLEEVGHGGMATVYRGRDPRLERDVALKVIHRHLRDNPEIAHRFQHEARAVAKLKHPSIVEIYDVPDVDDEERFLVAEYVNGPSLRRYLQDLQKDLGHDRQGLLPPEIAAALVLQVLSALARAHDEGIIHRDIKPENILVAEMRESAKDSGRGSQRQSDPTRTPAVAKLTDFGIAKILDAQSMTSTGQILGSPAHMAPEQIESGDITPRVDVFATGVLFYELLTGVLPFDGKNPAQVIRRVLEGEFTPADRVAPVVGGRFSAIVANMLAREPEQRPANANAVAELIRAELDAMGVTDPDRELLEFVRNPTAVAGSFGERVKPILLERAIAARERGDVVGSAHDLNRALAYDPTDPKLVRAVTNMRKRERRLRGLRRAIPIVVAAAVIAGGTFGVVRYSRTHRVVPLPSATAVPPVVPPPNTSINTSVDDHPDPPVDAGPAVTATTTATVTAPTSTPTVAVDAGGNTRKVRFNIFPAASYSIDGGNMHDSFKEPEVELSVGEHKITIVAPACCETLTSTFVVEKGEGPKELPQYRLKLKPAIVYVVGAEGASLTVRRAADDSFILAGPAPLTVPLQETSLAAKVTIEVPGFPAKVANVTLIPGPRYVQFDQ